MFESFAQDPFSALVLLLFVLAGVALSFFLIAGLIYYIALNYKYRNREKDSVDSTLIQISVPRDNEIKIDAAEQLFSSFVSLHESGRLSFLKLQPHMSFEIVGMPGDIRFYVSVPNKYKDFVEKQINGSYPDAEILEVDEGNAFHPGSILGNDYNIFSDNAKVAFASLKLKTSNYIPIKLFKDLPVDPLSSITSTLAKMTEGEGAAIQIVIAPAPD